VKRPAECLACDVTQDGRRFILCLVSSHYGKTGVAVFTEVTPEDGTDGEPRNDIFQDVGSWVIDGGRDIESGNDEPAEATPSVLKVDCPLPENVARSAVMNALLEQIGTEWSDVWEAWC
jgi:hypothetical protein